MSRVAAVLAVLAAAAFAACGQTSSAGDFKGEEAKVATVVDDLETNASRSQADELCSDQLTEALRAKVAATGQSCAAEMKKAVEDADTFDLDVEDVNVSGSTATARVSGLDDDDRKIVRTYSFVKVGNDWLIDSFGTAR